MQNILQFPCRPARASPPPLPVLDGARLLRRVRVSELERQLYRRILGDGMSATLTAPGEPDLPWFTTRWAMAARGGLRLTVSEARRLSQEAELAADDADVKDRRALRTVARRWAWRAARA